MTTADFVPFAPGEHTAELAFIARGRTLPELFENAALGLADLLYDPRGVVGRDDEGIEVEGIDAEELLVAWLQEILYRHEVRRRRFRIFEVKGISDPAASPGPSAWHLTAVARGEPWDPARHEARNVIKAATYHGLEIVRRAGPSYSRYEVRIVLDT